MNKIWEIKTIYILLLTFLVNINCVQHAKHEDLYKGVVGTKDLDNIDKKRSENDMYVFSNNMLQLSNQFPTISPFESLSLIWSSISDKINIENKNEGAMILLFMINPIYRLLNDSQYEAEELFQDIEHFDDYLSQIIYCLIQNKNENNCETTIEEFIAFLQDQILYEIQKHKIPNNEIDMTTRVNLIVELLNIFKEKQLFKIEFNNKIKLYPTHDAEMFLYYLFNINNLFDFYVDIQPGIPYIELLNPIRTLLDFMNKDWEIGKKEKVKSWFNNNTSPLKKICEEIIKGVEKIKHEINQYLTPKKLEKLIILTETKLYIDSLEQFCIEYNKFVDFSNSNSQKDDKIPKYLDAISSLLINEKNVIGKKISRVYENSRKAVDVNSNLCIVESDKKVLSSESLSEHEIDQEVSTTLLDLISNFFLENSSDINLQQVFLNNCPITRNLVENNDPIFNKDKKLIDIGNLLKDLSSILSVRRTHLAARICTKLNPILNDISYLNRRSISINRLLIPMLVNSILISVLPSNFKLLYSKKLSQDKKMDSIIFIDSEKSCLINSFDTLNYYIREALHICKIVKDHSTLFGSTMGKIANQKSITKINHNLQKVSQSQILHEFREIGRDIKGSKYGHFISEVGNTWSSSLSHWYHFSQKRRKLKGSRRLLRKAFYTYTSSLDNTNFELRPELKKIRLAAAKLGTNDIRLLTNGEFVFLNSKSNKNNTKKKYSKHTTKLMDKNYKANKYILKEEFPITAENIKELNVLIDLDMEKHKEELDSESSNIKTDNYSQTPIHVNNNNTLPFFKSGKIHYVIIGRDFSSFALCQCKIKGSRQSEMLQLFADLLFQIQHYDIRVTSYDLLSHSLKKAIRQMLIIISLNEFALHLLPKVRKGGYQRFYRMKHSTHKALRKRVKKYLIEIKSNTYKLSVILASLHALLLTAFNHFKYDPELELLRRTFIGIDIDKSDLGTYTQDYLVLKLSEAMRRKTIEKLIGNFYFGRIRRSFSSLKETLLQMMNPQQILGLSQIFKTDKGIKDIEGISEKLYQYFKSIYPSQNCIGVDQGQKLETFFSLC